MRITRLHILLGLMGLALMGYGVYSWMQRQSKTSPMTMPAHVAAPAPAQTLISTPPATEKKESVARMIATVGEAYRALPKRSGEIPTISHPLRMAKDYLASNQLHLAMVCARQAWTALENFKKSKENTDVGESYEVIKGDTLWRIARDRSPVHQGPGWVTIWKANKNVIKDFNRIEVGWNLTIPEKSATYVEPYWRPRQLAGARRQPPMSLAVNLPEVLAWADQQKKKTISGASLYAYLAAQENGIAAVASPKIAAVPARHPSVKKIVVVLAPDLSPFRRADFAVSARPFLESPQYQ